MKITDEVEILIGVYKGKKGEVEAMADAPKSIGVRIADPENPIQPLAWFKPEEVEIDSR